MSYISFSGKFLHISNMVFKRESEFKLSISAQLVIFLFIGCFLLSVIIPPLKSPDEFDHIERAYLLGKGQLLLSNAEGKASGGRIDSGLLKYEDMFPPYQDKLSMQENLLAGKIKWTGERIYDSSPGTGYYFPIIYIPQTLGLMAGEFLDLSVDVSYKLARLLSLFSSIMLLYAAFRLYSPNPLVLALIITPMTLFQMSSASLDGISTALVIFAISAFLRIVRDRERSAKWLQYSLSLSILILGSSRIHTLPMLILLAATYLYTKQNRSLLLFFLTTVFIVTWTFIAMRITVDFRVSLGESTTNIVLYYLKDPLQFLSVVWDTLLQSSYYRQFIGVLGWLDVPFSEQFYVFFILVLCFVSLLTLSFDGLKDDRLCRLLLLAVALISTLFIFFALLVTWSPHPANVVSGVQGRYFLIPSIFLAYSLSTCGSLFSSARKRLGVFVVLCLYLISIFSMVSKLVNRYYLSDFKLKMENVVYKLDDDNSSVDMSATPPLQENAPIILKFPELNKDDVGRIVRIGIRFGTHMRKNTGLAELRLVAKSGDTFVQNINLSTLVDNAYEYFFVPSDYYSYGEIRYTTGGGVSVWAVKNKDGLELSCLNITTNLNQRLTIKGCP